jgi:hypothetical protein
MKKRFSNSNEVYWGKEPDSKDFVDPLSPKFQTFLLESLAWYNYSATNEKKKKWFIDWVKQNRPKVKIEAIEQMNEGAFTTAGAVARMHSRGLTDSDYLNRKLAAWVSEFVTEGEAILIEKEEKKMIKKRASDSDPRLSYLMGLLEVELDRFMEASYKSTGFDMNDWLRANNPSPSQHSAIKDRFLRLLEELTDEDDQISEGYSHLSEKQFSALVEFILDIVSTKKVRKARVVRNKKSSSPAKQVSKMKYADYDPETGAKSVSPSDIPGSKIVWVWNKKYRMIGAYQAAGENEIAVKGTTLLNINEEASVWKKVRKPQVLIPQMMSASKSAMNKIFDGINSKSTKMTGRINSDTVILKVF